MQNYMRGARRRGSLRSRGSLIAAASVAAVVLAAGCGSSGGAHPAPGGGAGSALAGEGSRGLAGHHGQDSRSGTHSAARGAAALSGVGGGALFGGDVPLVSVQGELGRRLAIVRDYYRIGEMFPDQQDRQLMAAGTTMLVSLDSVPGQGPSYASIAAGQHDQAILTFLHQVEQAAVSYRLGAIYVAFEHEADGPQHAKLGPPSEFIAAWDHIHQLAASAHLNWSTGGRLHWTLILMSVAYRSAGKAWDPRAVAPDYWPGAGEVDIVAADGYNAAGCRSARPGSNLVASGSQISSPSTLFGPVISFARAHGGLPVFIAEWGTVPYTSPAMQPDYINQMRAYVTANPEIAAALYWNSHGQGNGCDYSLDSHPAAVAALAAMGRSAGLQGRIVTAN